MTNAVAVVKIAGKRRKQKGRHLALTPRFQYLGTPDPMSNVIEENEKKALVYGQPKYPRFSKKTQVAYRPNAFASQSKYVIMQPDRA